MKKNCYQRLQAESIYDEGLHLYFRNEEDFPEKYKGKTQLEALWSNLSELKRTVNDINTICVFKK
jgi:hypothetical protein